MNVNPWKGTINVYTFCIYVPCKTYWNILHHWTSDKTKCNFLCKALFSALKEYWQHFPYPPPILPKWYHDRYKMVKKIRSISIHNHNQKSSKNVNHRLRQHCMIVTHKCSSVHEQKFFKNIFLFIFSLYKLTLKAPTLKLARVISLAGILYRSVLWLL